MRVQNWPHALAEYLRAHQDKAFEWGANDCVHFAAGAVEAVTGSRPVFTPYRTGRDAAILVRAQPLRERVSTLLGPEITLTDAQRGDLVLIDGKPGPTLGVCFGEQSVFLRKDIGTQSEPTMDCLCAWRVE